MKRVLSIFVVVLSLVLAGSYFMSGLWGAKSEKLEIPHRIEWVSSESVEQFAKRNGFSPAVIAKVMGVQVEQEPARSMAEFVDKSVLLETQLRKATALEQEHASKNWKKIALKMGLWALFLVAAFMAARKGKFNLRFRLGLSGLAVVLFGVALGSDPSPMGTVKDAVVLFSKSGAVFPPRMIALAAFLLTVIVANKAICAWGCQLGTLQEFFFRINRNTSDTAAKTKQFKIPFVVSNTIRTLVFLALIVVGALWGTDIIEPIDPFKVFNPLHLGFFGGVFVVAVLCLAIFTYRPWCHLACPFGLVGWILERWSIYRIRVRESSCTSCGACARICPSYAMDGILLKKKVVLDCFSCMACVERCPTKSIEFRSNLN